MPIPASIKNIIKSPTQLIVRGTGLAALGLIAYDSHYMGKLRADTYASEKDADSSLYYLNNTLYTTNMSKVEDKVRDGSFNMELNMGWKRFFNEPIGYIKGFTSMLINHVVPLGLGIAALFGSKVGAIGVGVVGAYKFIKNFFGFGAPGGLNK